ncbi:MAG: 30S ribosomal protein S3 [Nitrospinota bacterium]|nr:30S ribosomal protein S3 [Nitrospinota bacterium]HJM41810.1 30S ribosomal protein S3 [Nitrospinota bacterium]
MGQKVHPTGFRLGFNKTWSSNWFARREFADLLHEDLLLRQYIKKTLYHAGVSKITIERASQRCRIDIWAARPGIIIGKRGSEVDKLRSDLQKRTGKQVHINIKEVRKAEADSQLVAENIALQLIRRVGFRRAMKRAVTSALRFGVRGIKVAVSGRLGGSEMSRSEWVREGQIPLHTLRADIDYGFAEARTTYGVIGVKVWVYKGESYSPFSEREG